MTMLELYGHIYDFFTGITWWKLLPDTNLVVSVKPHPNATDKAKAPDKVFAARNRRRGPGRGLRARTAAWSR